jgi:dienelactone hydrolase
MRPYTETPVGIPIGGDRVLDGLLAIPQGAVGAVLFVHGSGSSRFSPRNIMVARMLNDAGLSTLLVDLLTPPEAAVDQQTRQLRFDISLLAARVSSLVDWMDHSGPTRTMRIGLFGASTGAAAALMAAARQPEQIHAVVSRGGRPDLAATVLPIVQAPTLLLVGGRDETVIEVNRRAFQQIQAIKALNVIPNATHLFEEPGALAMVGRLAADWFLRHFRDASPI